MDTGQALFPTAPWALPALLSLPTAQLRCRGGQCLCPPACPLPGSPVSCVQPGEQRAIQHLGLEQRGLTWQSHVGCGKLGLAEGCMAQPASHGPSDPRAWLPVLPSLAALASLLRTCHHPYRSCIEQLPSAVAGVLELRAPQFMSPAPRPQPDPLGTPLGCACQLGSGAWGTAPAQCGGTRAVLAGAGPGWSQEC